MTEHYVIVDKKKTVPAFILQNCIVGVGELNNLPAISKIFLQF
jgi:hypothetical protein